MGRANDVQTLEQLNRSYVRAGQASDTRWFDEHLAACFMCQQPRRIAGRPCRFPGRGSVGRILARTWPQSTPMFESSVTSASSIRATGTRSPTARTAWVTTPTSTDSSRDAGSASPPTSPCARRPSNRVHQDGRYRRGRSESDRPRDAAELNHHYIRSGPRVGRPLVRREPRLGIRERQRRRLVLRSCRVHRRSSASRSRSRTSAWKTSGSRWWATSASSTRAPRTRSPTVKPAQGATRTSGGAPTGAGAASRRTSRAAEPLGVGPANLETVVPCP